jgi:hypothetical protein
MLSREGLAGANGGASEGSGFGGIVLSYVVSSNDRVDEILAQVEAAGGKVVEPGLREALARGRPLRPADPRLRRPDHVDPREARRVDEKVVPPPVWVLRRNVASCR